MWLSGFESLSRRPLHGLQTQHPSHMSHRSPLSCCRLPSWAMQGLSGKQGSATLLRSLCASQECTLAQCLDPRPAGGGGRRWRRSAASSEGGKGQQQSQDSQKGQRGGKMDGGSEAKANVAEPNREVLAVQWCCPGIAITKQRG